MFENLVRTIESLGDRIRAHGHHIGDYESRTRVALIDPFLTALGWNVSDPSQVEIETRTKNGWADYALLGNNGKPLIFVEAKKLSHKAIPVPQTVSYVVEENMSSNTDVRYCICTNGDTWTVLDVRSANPVIASVSLAQDSPSRCAVKLLGLWRSSLIDGILETPLDPLANAHLPPSEQSSSAPAKSRAPKFREPSVRLNAKALAKWTPLQAKLNNRGKPAPRSIRFPDGETRETTSWKDLLVETSQWLFGQGRLTPDAANRPFGIRGKTYLFSGTQQHPRTGAKLREPVRLGSGDQTIFLETHMSAEVIVDRTAELMERCGYQPSDVDLDWPATQ